jgi:hypothetical protein
MLIFVFLGLALSAFADPIRIRMEEPSAHGNYRIGVGSRISIDLPGRQTLHSGLFLGRLIEPNGTPSSYMFFDQRTHIVYYADRNSVEIHQRNLESILKLYEQKGGTCTGYAMSNLLHQMNLAGFQGNGKLKTILSTEQGRTQLLIDAINQYYLVLQHRYSIQGILNQYGREFGFTCQSKVFDTSWEVENFLQEKLPRGIPVLISFSRGPDMVTSKFRFVDFDHPSRKVDTRLWIPRKIGERNSGGHSVVAVAGFQVEDHIQLLMLDSDWEEPRIWDMNDYLDDRTALKEVTFVTCS